MDSAIRPILRSGIWCSICNSWRKKASAQDILDNFVFFTAGSCGPCRFGMYEAEYRFALRMLVLTASACCSSRQRWHQGGVGEPV